MHELTLAPKTGVVVTGGASGIGLASAHAVAAVGRPVAVWDLREDQAKEAAAAIADAHDVATLGIAVDVRDTPSLADAVTRLGGRDRHRRRDGARGRRARRRSTSRTSPTTRGTASST